MSFNAFAGKEKKPNETELTAALGKARPLWDKLLSELAEEFHLVTSEWGSSSTKAGWSLRLKINQRTIVYLNPGRSSFEAALALGARAVEAARAAGLPSSVRRDLEGARRYAEGTAVRVVVCRAADLPPVKKLVAAKLTN